MSQGQANPNYSITQSSKVSTIFPGDYASCDEGSFYVTTLAATASTAVAVSTQALGDTNPAIALFNGNVVGGQNPFNIYIRYIKMVISVVGGTNTNAQYSSLVDNLPVKLTTIGTALGAPQSTNTNSSTLSKMSGWGGVNIAAAQTAAGRRVGAGMITGAVQVALDEVIFDFGPPVYGKNLIGTTTVVSARTVPHPPVILAPGWWFTLGIWGSAHAASADTFAWEIGYIERPAGQ